uniref:Capsid protein n=1 Tax=Sophora yellow stunt virus TaxID=1980160 RepID=A0A1W5YSD8_9VIRU|nr:capsid protein [Sophora yellow stunt virus]WGT79585.1 capsid protein [Sophora yellow stunt virus]WGT79594.1 capsid protein [Sophora yellow stunt virus]WNA12231.1 capsid protein [Sophora yellow stunt virus]
MAMANWGIRRRRSSRRPVRTFISKVPSTKVLWSTSAVLTKGTIAGVEIRPAGEGVRYKMNKVMLCGTLTMNPGQLLNYIIVKSNAKITDWQSSFSSPSLFIKEAMQDVVTIVGQGKVEPSGYSGSEVTRSFRRSVRLSAGISQTQHLYGIFYPSSDMKMILEARMYIQV